MITAVDCTICRTSEECESEYLVQYLCSEEYLGGIRNFLAGGTRQRVSRSNLAGFAVPLPSLEEQKKIGRFLGSLDDLITLHQCKELTGYAVESGRTSAESKKAPEVGVLHTVRALCYNEYYTGFT